MICFSTFAIPIMIYLIPHPRPKESLTPPFWSKSILPFLRPNHCASNLPLSLKTHSIACTETTQCSPTTPPSEDLITNPQIWTDINLQHSPRRNRLTFPPHQSLHPDAPRRRHCFLVLVACVGKTTVSPLPSFPKSQVVVPQQHNTSNSSPARFSADLIRSLVAWLVICPTRPLSSRSWTLSRIPR